jgi:hypothetical protein
MNPYNLAQRSLTIKNPVIPNQIVFPPIVTGYSKPRRHSQRSANRIYILRSMDITQNIAAKYSHSDIMDFGGT